MKDILINPISKDILSQIPAIIEACISNAAFTYVLIVGLVAGGVHEVFRQNYENSPKYKQKKIFEVVEYLTNNINNKNFRSVLDILYFEVIKERHKWKRLRVFGIFNKFTNGFLQCNDKKDAENFELKKMLNTLNLMNQNDFDLCLKILDQYDLDKFGTGALIDISEKINTNNKQRNIFRSDKIRNFNILANGINVSSIEQIWNLINIGILVDLSYETYKFKLNESMTGLQSKHKKFVQETYKLSQFGKTFINSINF